MQPNWCKESRLGTIVTVAKSGWMNSEKFAKYFSLVLEPHFETLDGGKALILDNCSAHLSVEVLQKCEAKGISFIPLPPNTTWLTQPADVGLMKDVKLYLRQTIDEFNEDLIQKGEAPKQCLPKSELVSILDKTFAKIRDLSGNIRAAFHKTGLYPFNPNRVIQREFFQVQYRITV